MNESGPEVGRVVKRELGRRTGMSPYISKPVPVYKDTGYSHLDYLSRFAICAHIIVIIYITKPQVTE
jgi:hypothetical protein